MLAFVAYLAAAAPATIVVAVVGVLGVAEMVAVVAIGFRQAIPADASVIPSIITAARRTDSLLLNTTALDH